MHAKYVSLHRMMVLVAAVATLMAALFVATVSADETEIGKNEQDCRDSTAEACGQKAFGWFRMPNVVEFDVAEDMTRFAFDKNVTHDDGLPAYGSAFITQGYLYPVGTLNGSNGVMPDGSPEFPDKVVGEWTCYGYYVGDGAHTTTGPIVITTQIYNIGTDFGDTTVVTAGYEVADLNVPVSRAITGGTGAYKNARGDSSQQMVGLNATEGVVLRVTLTIQKF